MLKFARVLILTAGLLLGLAFAATGAAQAPPQTITATVVNGSNQQVGNVQLTQDSQGRVQLTLGVSGLAPGKHGIHIHAVGRCEGPAFTSAGGHFNPDARQHGLDNPQGHHAGDLMNIVVEANGTARAFATTNDVTLSPGSRSLFDADGSALVIHAEPDDGVTDPTGNSGARVACAVLAAANPALAAPTSPAAPTLPAAPSPAVRPPSTGAISKDPGTGVPVEAALGIAILALTAAIVGMRVLRPGGRGQD